MDLRQRRMLLYALAAIAALAALLIGMQLENKIAVLLILVVYVLISSALWRCPHCGAYLGRLEERGCCPQCGRKLDDRD